MSVGIVFCAIGIRKLFKRRFISGASHQITGLGLLVLSGILFLFSSNLYTYERLVYEAPVAELEFHQLDSQHYRVDLKNVTSGENQFYELLGDEWQLDAQILSWQGYSNLLGLDTYFRLHRLSGRYTRLEQERNSRHSVFHLPKESNFDLWQLANKYSEWVTLVDAMYGSAVFLPMTNKARYRITISRNGLVARPDNTIAKQAVSRWIGLD